MEFGIAILVLIVAALWMTIKIVPQQEAWVVENFGKFDRVLEPGMTFLVPIVQKIAYKHSLKEQVVDVHEQTAVTNDNVTLRIDGVLYVRIVDPKAASYGVSNPYLAVSQLAQTTMRAEIGKMKLDQTFEERETLNANIVTAINEASNTWGIQCMRYEIKDINPPQTVLQAMELQVAAERQKRAEILESEGDRQSKINRAEADKTEIVLRSEAAKLDQINRAQGEAEAIKNVAEANAEAILKVAEAIKKPGGNDAVGLKVAEKYVEAFGELAKESNTILLPANTGDAGSMVAQALSVFDSLKSKKAS